MADPSAEMPGTAGASLGISEPFDACAMVQHVCELGQDLEFAPLGKMVLVALRWQVSELAGLLQTDRTRSAPFLWACAAALASDSSLARDTDAASIFSIWSRILTGAQWDEAKQLQLCQGCAEPLTTPAQAMGVLEALLQPTQASVAAKLPEELVLRLAGSILARHGCLAGDATASSHRLKTIARRLLDQVSSALDSEASRAVRAAAQSVLPALLSAQLDGVRSAAVQALQGWCFGLLQPGQSAWARQTATALLVPFAERICSGDGAATARCVALLRDCLLEDETVQRKRAQHVLAQLAPGSTGMPAASWTAYDRLLGLTDEYSLHLFEVRVLTSLLT